jgi:hypothetical protein
LAAAIASWFARPTRAAADEMSTIEPPPRITLPPARTAAKAESRLAAIVCRHSSSLVACADFKSIDPTQLTRPSSRPWSSATDRTNDSTSAVFVASSV